MDEVTRYDVEAVEDFWKKMKAISAELLASFTRNHEKWKIADEACSNALFVTQATEDLATCVDLAEAIADAVDNGMRLHQEASAELSAVAGMSLY